MAVKKVKFNVYSLRMRNSDYENFESLSSAIQTANLAIELPLSHISPPDTLVMPYSLEYRNERRYIIGSLAFKQRSMKDKIHNDQTNQSEELAEHLSPLFATCFLYDCETGLIVVESVQKGKGPGIGQICDFLGFSIGGVKVIYFPVPNTKELEKLTSVSQFDRFEIALAKPNIGFSRRSPTAIRKLSKIADDLNGKKIKIEVSGGLLNFTKVKDLVAEFINGGEEVQEVKTFKLFGKDGDDSSVLIDILTNRIVLETEVLRTVNRDESQIKNAIHREYVRISTVMETLYIQLTQNQVNPG